MSDLINTLREQAMMVNEDYFNEDYRTKAADLIEQLQQRNAELLRGNDQLDDRISELEQRNNELSATVERLRVFANAVVEHVPDTPENHWIYPTVQTLKHCLKTTPRQNLAEHDTEVAREAFIAGYNIRFDIQHDKGGWTELREFIESKANEYAERVKRGES